MSDVTSQSGPTIEVRKRRKWPFLAGGGVIIVAIVVVATVLIVGRNSDDSPFKANDVTVLTAFAGGPEEATIKYVAKNIASDYGITIKTKAVPDANTLWYGTQDGDVAGAVFTTKTYYQSGVAAKHYQVELSAPLFSLDFGTWSDKYTSWDQIPDGATIGLRDDPATTSAGLVSLAAQGHIGVAQKPVGQTTIADVTDNPHHYTFKLLPANANVATYLPDVAAIQIWITDFANFGVPISKLIERTPTGDTGVEYLLISSKFKNDPTIQNLVKAFSDPRVAKWIATTDDAAVKTSTSAVKN
ncbi:MAG: MetQ/NlpA family ABC transporter substrate-binding protein [Gordonia sp. (in: high G+C Gram-positive bacteria)]